MVLELIEIFNGVLSLTFVVISSFVGLKIMGKYRPSKNINILLAGITWILMCEPWIAVSASFLTALITNTVLPLNIFFIIGFIVLPLGVQLWLIIFTNLLYTDYQKKISLAFAIVGVIFQVIFIYFLITNINLLGIRLGSVDIIYSPFMIIYIAVFLIIILVTGTRFAYESYKSDVKEVKLKGKLFFIAFYSYIFGTVMPVFSADSIILLTISKIVLIFSAIAFYGGFMLPRWLKNLFLSDEVN